MNGRSQFGAVAARGRRQVVVRSAVAACLGLVVVAGCGEPSDRVSAANVTSIVRFQPGREASVRQQIEALGGSISESLDLIDGVVAELPEDALARLALAQGVIAVTPDGTMQLLGDEWKPDKDMGSFYMINKSIGAQDVWGRSDSFGAKYTGSGIGVAVIDSGVAPVEGLTTPGKLVYGPDLSFDSPSPELRHLDGYGHGTHMAGIIAGRDTAVKSGNENDSKYFVGVAPGAHIVSVKVAASDGATDVSQVIAAIDWVVQHRNDPGLNIRVLNLSFGTTALQAYQLDPLTYAVEQAWHKGIVVVVAAGNDGANGTTLTNPAIDPFVIAVGAADHRGTEDRSDDRLADFSSVGNAARAPDLIAPGRSVTSLRTPGSWLDDLYPTAQVSYDNTVRFFRGSGTSQAAAVVSGAVALILDERPNLTPDQVKYVLKRNANVVYGPRTAQGAGQINLKDIHKVSVTYAPRQQFVPATGTGSLELARGGSYVADPHTGIELVGEFDIFGQPWNGPVWAALSASGTSWDAGMWNGARWTGARWTSNQWASQAWESVDWSGANWAGQDWQGARWSGLTWTGARWTGARWTGARWTGARWSGTAWCGIRW